MSREEILLAFIHKVLTKIMDVDNNSLEVLFQD